MDEQKINECIMHMRNWEKDLYLNGKRCEQITKTNFKNKAYNIRKWNTEGKLQISFYLHS